ncbi:MAG: pyridoxamine 5'-phosphate oxidase family protein [Deltaproteobacteria bacterium]|nr:pyridoxamine 5'-phosphate oxidase family protein [Deltaproteobacteria bacterium]
MKITNGKCDTLDVILDKIWLMLEQGATHSEDPFHWPILGTTAKEGCSLRTVILRQVNASDRILVCHTDARSAKVQEIINYSPTSWLFFHPQKKIQVRISGHATLHAHDPYADRQWADTSITSRLNYCTSQPPGTPIDKPSSGLPDFLLDKIPTLLETEMGRKHFMAIAVHIYSIDWLILKVTGNQRARFEWDEDRLRATWLVP